MFVTRIQKPQFCPKCAIISVHIGTDFIILPQGVGKCCKQQTYLYDYNYVDFISLPFLMLLSLMSVL